MSGCKDIEIRKFEFVGKINIYEFSGFVKVQNSECKASV